MEHYMPAPVRRARPDVGDDVGEGLLGHGINGSLQFAVPPVGDVRGAA